jgi:hypothetical protein
MALDAIRDGVPIATVMAALAAWHATPDWVRDLPGEAIDAVK